MSAASSAGVALVALLGGALLAGYVGAWLFRRHRISDIAFLLGVGLLVGPVLGLVEAAPLVGALAALAPIGLAVVLFEGGLELSWDDLRRYGGRAFGTGLLVWALSVVALTIAGGWFLGLPMPLALLFALPVSATGILAVIPLLQELRVPAATRVILTVETSLGDLLSAVATVALASVLVLGASPWSGALDFAGAFLIGASVGVLAGVASARVLHHLEGERHAYAVLLALVLLAYAFAEAIGGSGLLAALALGLVVGNARSLMARHGVARLAPPASALRVHQSHTIFLLRSVYFVFLGAVISREVLALPFLLAAIGLTAAAVAARVLAVVLARSPAGERGLLVAVMPRGLAAAILASVPAAMGVPGTESFVAYAFLVIVGTDVATTIGLWWQRRRGPSPGAAEPGGAAAEPAS